MITDLTQEIKDAILSLGITRRGTRELDVNEEFKIYDLLNQIDKEATNVPD